MIYNVAVKTYNDGYNSIIPDKSNIVFSSNTLINTSLAIEDYIGKYIYDKQGDSQDIHYFFEFPGNSEFEKGFFVKKFKSDVNKFTIYKKIITPGFLVNTYEFVKFIRLEIVTFENNHYDTLFKYYENIDCVNKNKSTVSCTYNFFDNEAKRNKDECMDELKPTSFCEYSDEDESEWYE